MDQKIWENPIEEKSLDQSESPFWFWNNKLEKKVLEYQLELMTKSGIRCNMPHGRGMALGNYIGGYLDHNWMKHIKTVLEYKEQKGEPVWIYDEMDWPAGTCNKSLTKEENNREIYLSFKKYEINAGDEFTCQLSLINGEETYGMSTEEGLNGKTLNVFLYDKETGNSIPIEPWLHTIYMNTDSLLNLSFVPEKAAEAYIVKLCIAPYSGNGCNWINYLDERVTEQFLDSTYEKYYEKFPEYFGTTIKAFFNDETRMANAFVWSRNFAEEFIKRKGYDICPHLPELVIMGDKAGRTRCDYFDVLADLYRENYLERISSWCEKHKVLMAAHLLGEETLASQVRYSGDFMRQFKVLGIPGIDHLGKGIGSLNAKFGSSAAHSYGKQNVTAEVFAGCGWDLNFEEYIRIIAWLYQQGIQIIINHAFFYSTQAQRADDWPPSQFFQWKYWDRMPEGNAFIRRLNYSLSGGIPEMDVLIYHPVETYWLHYMADENFTHGFVRGAQIKDKRAAFIDREMQLLMTGLFDKNIDFELLHKDAVSNFKAINGKIVNTKNGQKFKVLILPYCEVLSIETIKLTMEFVEQGGKVIVIDSLPKYAMPQEADTELNSIVEKLSAKVTTIQLPSYDPDAILAQKTLSKMELVCLEQVVKQINEAAPCPIKIVEGTAEINHSNHCYGPYIIDPFVHTGEDITGVALYRYIKDKKRNTFIMNYKNSSEVLAINIPGSKDPQIWDPFNGTVSKAEITDRGDNTVTICLKLLPNRGLILVSDFDQTV